MPETNESEMIYQIVVVVVLLLLFPFYWFFLARLWGSGKAAGEMSYFRYWQDRLKTKGEEDDG